MAGPLSSPDPPGSHMRPLTRLARRVFSASTLFYSFCKFHVQKTESRLLKQMGKPVSRWGLGVARHAPSNERLPLKASEFRQHPSAPYSPAARLGA
jgi:hypothetical protein